MKRAWRSVLLHIALVAGAIMALLPVIWMVAASLMPTGEATTLPPKFIPANPTIEHYRAVFTRLDMGRYLVNSTLVALLVTGTSLIINALAGYAFAKLRFRGRDVTFRVLTAGLMLPVQVVMLPLFLIFKQLGLINTYWGVIIPSMASIFAIFLIRQYATAIPDDLLDAARIDGASEARIFRAVVLPVITPILATLAIWTFLTLPVALANLLGEHVQDVELMMAGSVLTVVPVLVVFLFLQRYYIRGIMAGSVKG
jgi:multiple sugar transport system permease protein